MARMTYKPDHPSVSIPARDLGAAGRLTNQRLRDPPMDPGTRDGLPTGPDEREIHKHIGGERVEPREADATDDVLRKHNGFYNRMKRISE